MLRQTGTPNDRTVFITTLGIADVPSAAAIPDDGAWHHIAVIHEAGLELRFYIDGALGSRGAALVEPYSDDPGNTDETAKFPAVVPKPGAQAKLQIYKD